MRFTNYYKIFITDKQINREQDLNFLTAQVVLMSATIDVAAICNYWRRRPPGLGAAVTGRSEGDESAIAAFRIEGRAHPVQVLFAKRPHSDYLSAALALTLELHRSRRAECASSCFSVSQCRYSIRFDSDPFVLYCTLPVHYCSEGILIFLTGEDEIETACNTLRKCFSQLESELTSHCEPLVPMIKEKIHVI